MEESSFSPSQERVNPASITAFPGANKCQAPSWQHVGGTVTAAGQGMGEKSTFLGVRVTEDRFWREGPIYVLSEHVMYSGTSSDVHWTVNSRRSTMFAYTC